MRFFRRNWVLFLFILLLLIPLFLFFLLIRNNLPANVTDLWTKPENRVSFIISFSAGIAYAVLASFVLISRRAIMRWINAFVLRGHSVEEERRRVEQERLYLENLIERFRLEFPWEVDKYADLEAIQEDLEKQAKRVQPRLWNLPDAKEARVEENLRSRVNVRHFLCNEKGPIMLKGEPGAGKTLTVRRFAVDQAEDALRNLPGEVKIPIYILLDGYNGKTKEGDPEPIFDFLQRYLQEQYPAADFLREHLTEYLVQGRLLLLFDGLNELPPNEYLPRYQRLEEFVLRKYPKNKAIFTCRTLRYTSLSHFNTVVLSDLSNDQIKRFVTAYCGDVIAELIYRELTSGDGFMLRICRNPFMLQMLKAYPKTTNLAKMS